jgi:hypothetical protein
MKEISFIVFILDINRRGCNMSYLKWNLDTEEELDAYDPLGEIAIIGNQGKLEEKCTYLDAFFEALVQGIQRIKKGEVIEIDPLVEPDDIIFDYTGENLIISYGKQQTTIFDEDQLIKNLQEAVKNLLERLDNAAINAKEKTPKLLALREFLHSINC